MIKTKFEYEAPAVRYLKFDAGDILRTSGWNFNCNQSGGGNNAEPPFCSIDVSTDNSMN